MNKKDKMQNKELNKVTGGIDTFSEVKTTCQCCGEMFYCSQQESKSVGSGCDVTEAYKCPNCQRWVYGNGEEYKGE